MDEQWSSFCAICASADPGGELRIRGERGNIERTRLCTVCFGFLSDAHRAAATGSDADTCSLCGEGRGVFAVKLLPDSDAGPGHRPPSGYLVCDQCLAWTRDLMDGESLARWARRRESDGPSGGWPHPHIAGLASFGLDEHDQEAASQAADGLCRAFVAHHTPEAVHAANAHAVYLVRAAQDRAATAFVASLAPELRSRVAIVASPEHTDDVGAALALGAAEVLASPLSRQQVLGAIARIAAGPEALRDEHTALPRYPVRSHFGLPCYGLRIEADENVLETVLVLRRFLRGYDAVGGDGEGHALALVYCDGDELDSVLRRLGRLLGEKTTVNVIDFAAAATVRAPGGARRALPLAAAAFFGASVTRAS